MLSSVEQAFVGRDEKRAPLKTPAWEARQNSEVVGICSSIGGDRNMQEPLSDSFERVKFSLTYTEIP